MTQVERKTRCFVAHRVVYHRCEEILFEMIWQEAPSAREYYNDALALYDSIGYPGKHESLPNKSQTYSVEGDNAELRHYLARLARRSRCFSRSLEALSRAVDLFIFAWNRRQRWKRANPRYHRDIRDFITQL
jgi:IS1 family transposase